MSPTPVTVVTSFAALVRVLDVVDAPPDRFLFLPLLAEERKDGAIGIVVEF
jgi:hypothetical protein